MLGFALCCGFPLVTSAYAGDAIAARHHHFAGSRGSIIGIGVPGGTYVLPVSASRSNGVRDESRQLAPKAKIIDVKEALQASPCTYQASVCIIRP
ncbi:hypothetical protein BJF91_00780 [Allorhizobium taibaishanense]|uniref:Uncharacterized protein n=1 Tax=Allorhizobium taibaishanense TaxID=887144 RepID=A0A1Q9A1X0_9HYPH|nr:hypothetical protein [Allorhizobium taibaishanense]OLP48529.1 hypothetical protein BJF91_00780 [Allorhizobium taibaishanense]